MERRRPQQLKVCVNELGGFRNTVELVLTGLDVEAKADWVREQLTASLGSLGDRAPATVTWSRTSQPPLDAGTEEAASVLLRCTVQDPSADPVGRSFTAAAVELALASYPGFTMTAPPGPATPYGVYRAAYVDRSAVTHTVVHADGTREVVADPTSFGAAETPAHGRRVSPYPAPSPTLTRRMPLGTFVHARSGDKGGDANLGLWVAHDDSGDVRRPGHLADQADRPEEGPRAGAGGGGPRGGGLRAAEPRRRQRADPRAAR